MAANQGFREFFQEKGFTELEPSSVNVRLFIEFLESNKYGSTKNSRYVAHRAAPDISYNHNDDPERFDDEMYRALNFDHELNMNTTTLGNLLGYAELPAQKNFTPFSPYDFYHSEGQSELFGELGKAF